ncbi:sialidase family protein [Parafilimonas sp.]|uniref:sialidase family protein n=1 Tax=Parafilimonas sp. TaxID=1969739 RepID=UPI0039E4E007
MFNKIVAIFAGWALRFFISSNEPAAQNKAEGTSASPDGSAAFTHGYFFEAGQPFAQCHASTILYLQNGMYMAAWFGGTKEGRDDVGIWLTKGRPGNWSKPVEIAKIRNDAHWNPVLFQSPEGRIFLFFKVGKKIPFWETWVKTSEDNGQTWSEAKELVPGDKGGRGPVRNKPVMLSNGAWIAGASNENGDWNAFADISKDGGKTWKASDYIKLDRLKLKGRGVIQPTLWESAPGKVHMLLRSTDGAIYRADSEDYGETWSDGYKTNLLNPNSGIDLTKLPDGTLVLAYNPDTANSHPRTPLSLAISFDNGKTWPKILDIDSGNNKEEFSYPGIISHGDTIAVSYTWKRQKIAYWTGTKEELIKAAKNR